MSTSYYVETIERITEQMLTEEIISDVNKIQSDADDTIKNTRDDAVDTIENIKTEAINEIPNIEQDALTFIADQKRDMIITLAETGIRGQLRQIDADADVIYKKLLNVAPDTEAEIEQNIRTMIVNDKYSIVFVNDGNGNITAMLRKAV